MKNQMLQYSRTLADEEEEEREGKRDDAKRRNTNNNENTKKTTKRKGRSYLRDSQGGRRREGEDGGIFLGGLTTCEKSGGREEWNCKREAQHHPISSANTTSSRADPITGVIASSPLVPSTRSRGSSLSRRRRKTPP
ncbi:hypothetical protein Taro_009865 [Colocasia esculenta]|uniref:Uncharacterized protein n=1 Tax=Colocasia esculenta TaxID=4460 RepID=A0A843U664_COLES|nr:hypothetical protein [Colocasia esculenta]